MWSSGNTLIKVIPSASHILKCVELSPVDFKIILVIIKGPVEELHHYLERDNDTYV